MATKLTQARTDGQPFPLPVPTEQGVLRPHRRQFVVGPCPCPVYEDWCRHLLGEGLWITHCPELRVGHSPDAEGCSWWLLGLAVETQADRLAPLAAIGRSPTRQVPDLYPSWAGRWILIGQGQLHLDASGLLGCFYGQTRQGEKWASSSPALLISLLALEGQAGADPRSLQFETGISWYPPPHSRFAGIARLLPSQVLNLREGTVQPRSLMPPLIPSRSLDQALECIQHILVTTLKHLPSIQSQLWLGLTAGYDSRLMMAMSRVAGIPVTTFTRIALRMSVADRLLPPQLARDCGYEHLFLRGSRHHPQRLPLVRLHSAGHVSEGDATPFVCGDRDRLQGLAFGGHGFAVASGFFQLRQLPATLADAETGARQLAQLFLEPVTSTATVGLRDWLTWVIQHPQPHLDWRDRFFIEQRQAGWLSAKEQVYDLADLERFPILNSAHLYSILLSVREDDRLDSKLQAALIQQVAPELCHHPFNPKDAEFGWHQVVLAKATDYPAYLLRKVTRPLRWQWRSMQR